MYFKSAFKSALVLTLTATAWAAQAQDVQYQFKKKIALPGDGKWDYLKTDRQGERLFVSHFDRVQVIDLKSDSLIGTISDLKGAHGIALAPAEGFGYISNGLDNTVTVFDYKTLKTVKVIPVSGKKPDAIIYEPFSKQIITFCKNSRTAVIIDIASNREAKSIDLQGAPEFAVADDKGMVYNNLEDKNEVIAIDIKKQQVIKRYSLKPNTEPTGLAIDKLNNRLFVSCSGTKTLVVLDAVNGHIVTTLPIGDDTDAVVFDQDKKIIAASNADGTATIIKQLDANHYKVVQTLQTAPGSKTMAYRASTHNLYFSSTEKSGKTITPGTFAVSIYSPVQ